MQLNSLQKTTALRLIEGLEIQQDASNFSVNFLTVVPFFKVHLPGSHYSLIMLVNIYLQKWVICCRIHAAVQSVYYRELLATLLDNFHAMGIPAELRCIAVSQIIWKLNHTTICVMECLTVQCAYSAHGRSQSSTAFQGRPQWAGGT